MVCLNALISHSNQPNKAENEPIEPPRYGLRDNRSRPTPALLLSAAAHTPFAQRFLRHQAGVNCIPLLTCQLHQGLIAHGEHLVSRCQGWTDDMVRQKGWAPEVA